MVAKTDLVLFYLTIPNQDCGEKIASTLINKKLIACANIFSPHLAIYEWMGQIQKEEERVMIMKSQKSYGEQIEKVVKELHPYETPCLLQLEVNGCNAEFINWVKQVTNGDL